MARLKTIGNRVPLARSRIEPTRHGINYGRGRSRYAPGRDARRERVIKRDKFRCQQCLIDGAINILLIHSQDRYLVGYVDHYVPLSQGGPDTENNQWLLCKLCHDQKSIGDSQGVYRETKDFGVLGVAGFA